MSGHSKWSTIKRKKGAADAKRGAIFTKVAKMITIAARQGGGDIDSNPRLSLAVDKARSVNMPKDNIERAIKRGTGEIEGGEIEEMKIEAYGPGGSAFIINAITDNKNRTISEIRNILSKHDGKIAEAGSVAYQFKSRGIIVVSNPSDEIELQAIDAGAEDTQKKDDHLIIYTPADKLKDVRESLSDAKIESAETELVSQNEVTLADNDKKKVEKLAEDLSDHDDVNELFDNIS